MHGVKYITNRTNSKWNVIFYLRKVHISKQSICYHELEGNRDLKQAVFDKDEIANIGIN